MMNTYVDFLLLVFFFTHMYCTFFACIFQTYQAKKSTCYSLTVYFPALPAALVGGNTPELGLFQNVIKT